VNDMSTTETHRAVAPDIVSAAFKADPLPACAHLRAEQPVARVSVPGVSGEAYLVTRYEDAAAVLRDERFVKDVRNARDPGNLRRPWVPGALKPLMHTMLDNDGAEHHRLRGLVRDTFAPRYVAQLEPRVQQVAGELLERMAAAGKADLVADYALLLPLTLISEILGVDERDRLRFRRWFNSLVAASAFDTGQPSLAAFAADWNAASSIPGTSASVVRSIFVIPKPSPTLSSRLRIVCNVKRAGSERGTSFQAIGAEARASEVGRIE